MSARHLSVAVTLLAAARVAGWSTAPLLARHTACRPPSQLPHLAMTETVGSSVSTAAPPSQPADDVQIATWGTPELDRDEEECEIEFVDPDADAALWPWRLLLLAVTGTWGANFAAMKLASDALGSAPESVTLFLAARFSIAFVLLSPSLLLGSVTDPMAIVITGVSVGALTLIPYPLSLALTLIPTLARILALNLTLALTLTRALILSRTLTLASAQALPSSPGPSPNSTQ